MLLEDQYFLIVITMYTEKISPDQIIICNLANHFLNILMIQVVHQKNAVLCTIDVVGLYFNISYEESLASIRKHLNNRVTKEVTADTFVELTDDFLKINYSQFLDKIFKLKQGTAIGTKFAPDIPFYP